MIRVFLSNETTHHRKCFKIQISFQEKLALQADVNRVTELEKLTSAFLSGPLWMPHTEALLEKLRDSMSIQQMNEFMAWTSIADEELT